MSTRFMTLMQREWMQHHRGWLILMLVLPLLMLLALPFGDINIGDKPPPLTVLAGMAMVGGMFAVWGLSWMAAMFQLPGLARRDSQDRSIEFWLSLPATHAESIGATLLVHALLVPLLALGVGAAGGLLIGAGIVVKVAGLAALAQVSWLTVIAAGLVVLTRLALGMLLLTLWVAPLFMLLTAASAWLKRWGTPAVVASVAIIGLTLDKAYENPIVWKLLQAQIDGAGRAFFDAGRSLQSNRMEPEPIMEQATMAARWALSDGLTALGQLASPHLLGGLLLAGGCFWLMMLARARSH